MKEVFEGVIHIIKSGIIVTIGAFGKLFKNKNSQKHH